MKIYMLVEGETDAALIRRVLAEEAMREVQLVAVGGGLPSLAASLLAERRCPVVVVLDADSFNPRAIAEKQQETEDLIRLGGAAIPVKVVLAVPEIEAWFFAAPEAIERMVGQPVSPDWLFFGKRDPKGVLRRLAEINNRKWDTNQAINVLDAHDIERIRAVPEVAELNAFLQDVQKGNRAA